MSLHPWRYIFSSPFFCGYLAKARGAEKKTNARTVGRYENPGGSSNSMSFKGAGFASIPAKIWGGEAIDPLTPHGSGGPILQSVVKSDTCFHEKNSQRSRG